MENDSALAAVRSAAQSVAENIAGAAVSTVPGNAQPGAATSQPANVTAPTAPTAAAAEQVAQAKADGRKEGASAEKQRLSAIMKLDVAAERQSQALALALDTDVSTEQAAAVLKASPVGGKASGFDAIMGKLGNPSLGAGGDKKAEVKPQIDRAGVFDRYNNVGKSTN